MIPKWAEGREESEVRLEVEDYVDAAIETEDGRKWVYKLRSRINERQKTVEGELHALAVKLAWELGREWKVGQVVWCNAAGVFFGGNVQRGDARVLVRRTRTHLWFAPSGSERDRTTWIGYAAAGLQRYDFRATPPEKPLDEKERRLMDRLGETLNSTVSDLTRRRTGR